MTHDNTRRDFLRNFGAIGTLSLSLALAGCSSDSSGKTTSTTLSSSTHKVVTNDNNVFKPATVTIAKGETVVWKNVGRAGHSVTAYEDKIPEKAEYFASGGFDSEQTARDSYAAGEPDSGDLAAGETYEHTFEVSGTYEYFCIPHEMFGDKGTVKVTE
ncbi:plastocyanin/azurin family copper-binding protein [Haladaptatus sp. NG-SE-30]